MKIAPTSFRPIHLILETQEEVDGLFALLCCRPLSEAVKLEGAWQNLTDCSSPAYEKLHEKLATLLR